MRLRDILLILSLSGIERRREIKVVYKRRGKDHHYSLYLILPPITKTYRTVMGYWRPNIYYITQTFLLQG